MTAEQRRGLRKLEGQTVHLALSDGSRLDAVSLVSARGRKLWVFADGHDTFVPLADVIDYWEAHPARSAA